MVISLIVFASLWALTGLSALFVRLPEDPDDEGLGSHWTLIFFLPWVLVILCLAGPFALSDVHKRREEILRKIRARGKTAEGG